MMNRRGNLKALAAAAALSVGSFALVPQAFAADTIIVNANVITVDPERDTLGAMKDYVSNFDPRIEALVPTGDQLKQLASEFRVYYAKVPTSDGSYTMDHTASVFLFGRDGRFAGTLAYDEAADTKQAKLKRLLGG